MTRLECRYDTPRVQALNMPSSSVVHRAAAAAAAEAETEAAAVARSAPAAGASASPQQRARAGGSAGSAGRAGVWVEWLNKPKASEPQIATLTGGGGNLVWQAEYAPSGRLLAVAGSDCGVYVLDGESGEEKAVLVGHTKEVLQLVWNPQEDAPATGWDRLPLDR